jgi:NACalpha-BTF3-like transcription factor
MSDDQDIDGTVEEEKVLDKGEKGREAKQLNSVTDFVEEKQTLGAEKAQKALTALSTEKQADEQRKKAERELELANIKVAPQDIELLKNELELSEELAERRLKEFNNDIQAAIRDYIK